MEALTMNLLKLIAHSYVDLIDYSSQFSVNIITRADLHTKYLRWAFRLCDFLTEDEVNRAALLAAFEMECAMVARVEQIVGEMHDAINFRSNRRQLLKTLKTIHTAAYQQGRDIFLKTFEQLEQERPMQWNQ
jgi:hypothetical protein